MPRAAFCLRVGKAYPCPRGESNILELIRWTVIISLKQTRKAASSARSNMHKMKKILIGIYLFCALVYFALNDHRITADPSNRRSHERQALYLATESLFFPLFLSYYYLYADEQEPPLIR